MAHTIIYCCCIFCEKYYPSRYMPYEKWREWKKGTSATAYVIDDTEKSLIVKKRLKKTLNN